MKRQQPVLDRLDWRILEALQANSRVGNTELGKQVGLSPPAIAARIRRLEDDGVIEGYGARINPKLAGRPIAAMIRIRTTHAHIGQCLAAFDALPEVIEAHRITGEDCFVVRVVAEDLAKLESVIDTLAKFGPVSTGVVLASYPPKPIHAP